jgi:DNA modification methylase
MTEQIKLSDLQPDHRNANKGSERGAYMVEQSLRKLGAGRSILLDKNGKIIAGNKTAEAAGAIDLDDVVVVRTDGKKLVAVMREDLDLDDDTGLARELAYADNRTGQVSLQFDPDVIAADLELGVDLGDWFQDFELEEIGAVVDEPLEEGDAEPQISRADELREEWGVELGQMWRLPSRVDGQEHRLICGDCTDAAVVDRVMGGEKADMMFTDPPYGVGYTGGIQFQKDGTVQKNNREALEGDATPEIYAKFLPVVLPFVDGPCYVWFAASVGKPVYDAILDNKCELHAMLIWHKTNATYAAMNAQYKQRHEPCMYFKPKKSTLRWCGATTESTIWEVKRDGVNEFHPTQKPIELATKALNNHDALTVLDVFCGSGSTIIAAENLSRQCRAVEISPAYVAVALQRYQDAFGITAELVQ